MDSKSTDREIALMNGIHSDLVNRSHFPFISLCSMYAKNGEEESIRVLWVSPHFSHSLT